MVLRILYIVSVFLFIGGCTKDRQVVIVGKVHHPIENHLHYAVPINGVTFGGFGQDLGLSSTQSFRIVLENPAPGVVEIWHGSIKGCVFVEPGNRYKVVMNTVSSDSTFLVWGKNARGGQFYRSLKRPSMIQQEARKYSKDTLALTVKNKLDELKEKEIEELSLLLRGKVIDHRCFRFIKSDIDYYYALLLSEIFASRFLKSIYSPNEFVCTTLFPESFETRWGEVFKQFPVQSKKAMRTKWWFDYAFNCYINYETYYKGFKEGTFDKAWFIEEVIEKGQLHQYTMEQAEKNLSGDFLEYFQARYLYKRASQKVKRDEWLSAFEAFRSTYPSSKFRPFLEARIVQNMNEEPTVSQDPNW